MTTSLTTEWSARAQSREHELGQSYTVLFFLGDVPESTEDWRSSPSFIGQHVSHTWSGPVPEEDDTEIEGFISLQKALKLRSSLLSLEPELVVPYLRDNLRWRIQKIDGDVVDNVALSSLKVTVFTATDAQKRAGEMTEYPECTAVVHSV